MQRRPVPPRASRTADNPAIQQQPAAGDDYDDVWPPRLPTSTRAYVNRSGDQVYEQGNRRVVFHQKPPRKPFPWLSLIGIGMIVALLLVWGVSALTQWWDAHQLDATFGFPRTYQIDEVVGHDDSTAHPTHFIFLNLKGRVVIIELPGGKVAQTRIYNGPAIIGNTPDQIPITATFQDVNGDGKVDMLVSVGNQQFTYINDGTQFKPQQ